MQSCEDKNKRIASNTLFLYIRTMLIMLINLYASRVILNVLGIEDYGIYNIVGGFVLMFSLISSSVTGAIQRFITFEIGKTNAEITKVFSTCVSIVLIFALIIVILLETLGIWFLNTELDIPTDRLEAANWVFQFSIATFAINLISVPYNATIIAYERMKAFAYIGLLEAGLKLAIVFLLSITTHDALILYACLVCIVAILIRCIYGHYCKSHFPNCSFTFSFDKKRYSAILQFSGWTFIGSSSTILMTQGVNVLINLFFGVTFNAARGIATQVENIIIQFGNNFLTAINPQITKSYASNDRAYMIELLLNGSRFSYYLTFIISFPIIICAEQILLLWLKNPPVYATIFVQLALIYTLIASISNPLITAMLATGNIKKYQLIVGGLQLLNFPVVYIIYKYGGIAECAYYIAILLSIVCLVARLHLLKDMIYLPIKRFIIKVIFPIISTTSVSCAIIYTLNFATSLSLFFELSICFFSGIISIFIFGLSINEKKQILKYISNRIQQS